ncbi:preprotein translocase subunit SecG [Jonesia denitrificans]|uniref:Protein-export membrane protein SecG n=1 Tax=Jonesia denitrificans (strain ATCC 14870 / DSM 20603 / BCRC 15368 / CIP 55.134 / JCM 11481 / NBRC 15587 / NCTC 10816 / Prevot 55134) TaxID=471856 RepID=C7R458_JONDD|nr:preprotein translocase subunit SecG [Jonesia denitrificans]ACV08915.1 preprotein translocase, SecG subunit [Jonesia denitrificans DSM 20603]ASE09774.1 preprotein translocase subunit SecG [Jonesia denitrificans]QXB44310.1 preprotein translocase subunit SecG [Jonesia denitrificans]SQH20970.1 preprotein translocase subunit SecG [Jonesia denitrificans]
MDILRISLEVLLVVTSILLILLVLTHKGKGGGMSDMFGGGVSTSIGNAGNAQTNLNRITIAFAIVWFAAIVLLGLFPKVTG